MFEKRENHDGTFYVVELVSGQLAHTEDADGVQRAAIGLDEPSADRLAEDLSNQGHR